MTYERIRIKEQFLSLLYPLKRFVNLDLWIKINNFDTDFNYSTISFKLNNIAFMVTVLIDFHLTRPISQEKIQ